MNQARAILWAQWRMLRNFSPRVGAAWSAILGALWYGAWLVGAVGIAWAASLPAQAPRMGATLPGLLVLVFLYWQLAPLMLAATGFSLDLRKLQAYPIPVAHLFSIEVMLRTTSAVEMLLLMLGLAAGLAVNRAVPKLSVAMVFAWIAFNLLLSAGLRDLLGRLLARRRIREIVFFLIMLSAVLPQTLIARFRQAGGPRGAFQARFGAQFNTWFGTARAGIEGWWWPWSAVADVPQRHGQLRALIVLSAWCLAAWCFGRWQFARVLSFDAQAAGAAPASAAGSVDAAARTERLFSLPSAVFRDPLGALIEKDLRSLLRSPRFRVLFIMGFTFGVLFWLPLLFGRNSESRDLIGGNFLTVACNYSLLLLGEVCFWNVFGFDRSAAQVYFLAPVPFATVLIGKNLTALIVVAMEISAIGVISWLLRVPFTLLTLVETVAVTGVVSLLFLAAGNLISVHQARASDPSKSFRNSAAGRVQALLLLVYPLVGVPVGLAYLARWAFESEAAFFGVLTFDALAAGVFYKIALDSAVEAADRVKERMLAGLAEGASLIAG